MRTVRMKQWHLVFLEVADFVSGDGEREVFLCWCMNALQPRYKILYLRWLVKLSLVVVW